MITLSRLDLVRQSSPATADELQSLQTQLNALPLFQAEPKVRVTVDVPQLTGSPSGFIEIVIRGTRYVLPFYAKGE